MRLILDPVWPIIVLAIICFVDGLLCLKPVQFIADCFRDVGWPKRMWPLMPIIKFAAAAGLVAGLWIPWLGLVTTTCLVIYFIIAIGMHVRARDFGRNLFLNASAMLAICVAVLVWSFVI